MDYYKESEWLVIPLPSNFTFNEAKSVIDVFKRSLQAGERKMVIDASGLIYINSIAIGILLELLKSMRNAGGEIRIRDLKGEPLNIFQKCGLHHIFNLEDSESGREGQELAFQYSEEKSGDIAIIHLTGMIYFPHDGKKIEELLDRIVEKNAKVLLNLGELKYLDSQTINLLISVQTEIKTLGKEIRYFGASELMRDIFSRVGFNQTLRGYKDRSVALSDWQG